MNSKIGFVVLIALCLALIVTLSIRSRQAAVQHEADQQTILDHSNRWQETSAKLGEREQVILNLEKDLEARKKDIGDLTNQLTRISTNLARTETALARTETALKATQEEVTKRDTHIAELENENQALDKRALDLGSAITNLNLQIEDTQKKLAAAEGDKAFLEQELKRLMTEKAELERQFNDLALLRAQVKKLKEELSIARRLEWIRQGLFSGSEQKGAQKLMQGLGPPEAKARVNYDLNVEVNADGTIKVIPPATNPPAAAPPALQQ